MHAYGILIVSCVVNRTEHNSRLASHPGVTKIRGMYLVSETPYKYMLMIKIRYPSVLR